jgi:hypothetical protein
MGDMANCRPNSGNTPWLSARLSIKTCSKVFCLPKNHKNMHHVLENRMPTLAGIKKIGSPHKQQRKKSAE